MELSQFITLMERQQAQQAILPPGQPPRFLAGSEWEDVSLSPSEAAIEMMLRGAIPITLRPRLDEVKGKFHFDYATAGGTFRVQVESERGERQIIITRLGADGQPLAPLPNLAPACAPLGVAGDEKLSLYQNTTKIAAALPPVLPSLPRQTSGRKMGAPPLSFNTPPPSPAGLPPLPNAVPAPPPLPSPVPEAIKNIEWHHAVSGSKVGPISTKGMLSLIKSNIIKPETMVWHQGMPEWEMAKLTELDEFFVVTHPIQKDSDTLFNTLPDTPFDTFMMSISTGTWRALGILLFLLIVGRIGLGVARYQNGGRDFGAELAREVMAHPHAAPLSTVKLELGEGVYDRETMTKHFDKYKGTIRYKDGDAGSLTLNVTSRDWLYRPEQFSFSFKPTDFGSMIAGQIRGNLSQRLLAQGNDARITALGLGRVTRTDYSGQLVLDDDFKHPLGVSVRVQSFNEDGSPAMWVFSVE